MNIEKKGLQLSIYSPLDSLKVYGDAIKLKQVIINIVHNALKFTETGMIAISIDIITANNSVMISIKDTGIGIEPQLQDKLFRPFEMIDSSTTRKYGGTGLGLAISRNYIELMGGSINLYSEGINKGTIVQIQLPLLGSKKEELAITSLNVDISI